MDYSETARSRFIKIESLVFKEKFLSWKLCSWNTVILFIFLLSTEINQRPVDPNHFWYYLVSLSSVRLT